ncbi:hypothetical protein F0U44_19275 [Nocardioides humilatus]|uniref:Carboxypeptidase regulatory-like domain-containing protein n=1 Tax=Nocardioides humilatus TaxID=2607660 RepID=A0A5B1L7J7_9ACTN|nr:hypothetical protein [Nocardioides humilatus]KAA1416454.1 hypothetical protein F0U44_19275 [Nocardioides humilatus]
MKPPRTNGAMLLALVAVLSLAGCAHENDERDEQRETERGTSLTITTRQTIGDVMYIEGAVPDIVVESADGTTVRPTRQRRDMWIWDGLTPGTYTLRAGLRPCGGNCGSLDRVTDKCRGDYEVEGEVRLHVHLEAGRPCEIEEAADR